MTCSGSRRPRPGEREGQQPRAAVAPRRPRALHRARRCRAAPAPWRRPAGQKAPSRRLGGACATRSARARSAACRRSRRPAASRTRTIRCPGTRRCCCLAGVRSTSSPARIIGTPWLRNRMAMKFLRLAAAQRDDRGVVAVALDAAVPATGCRRAVAVVLAVGLVVLALVADQVHEREAVVAGDEVDAIGGQPAARRVQVARSREPRGHLADEPGLAAHEAAHHVAIAAVPLGPAHAGKRADLVQAGRVPRLGDQPAARPASATARCATAAADRRAARRPRRARTRSPDRSGSRPRRISSRPVLEAVHDEARHQRVVAVDRVAAAGVVPVAAPVARFM